MQTDRHSESGNVLFLILIAVALFAALSVATTSSNRSGTGNSDDEVSLIDSSEIVQFANALENAITYLRVSRRCLAENISFEGAPFDGSDTDYINPSAPPDFSCHVFHPKGGRVTKIIPPKGSNDGRAWAYIEATVLGIGADQTTCGASCNELVIVLGGLKQNTCKKLNLRIMGAETIPVQDDGNNYEANKFTGTFTDGADNIDGGAAGRSSLCTEDSTGVYYYYHTLLPR